MSRISIVCFSPAGGTRKIVTAAAQAAAERLGQRQGDIRMLDITLPDRRRESLEFSEEDLVFLAVPTYAGRMPNKIMPYIRECIKGGGAAGVPIATFGGRSFDDALAELSDIMEAEGFRLAGGGAFVCEHAFAHRVASGRPDSTDMENAAGLGRGVAENLLNRKTLDAETFPGNHPAGPYYIPKGLDGQPAVFLKAKPVTDCDRCTGCGRCAMVCPMGSVDPSDAETKGICIKCQACILRCPAGARSFDDEAFLSHKAMLEATFAGRRAESVYFF